MAVDLDTRLAEIADRHLDEIAAEKSVDDKRTAVQAALGYAVITAAALVPAAHAVNCPCTLCQLGRKGRKG